MDETSSPHKKQNLEEQEVLQASWGEQLAVQHYGPQKGWNEDPSGLSHCQKRLH